jgi:hypothetical protein
MLVFSAAIVAGQRTVGNMCEDFGTNGELCEYNYDASADRLTIHGRIDITGSGFAQSCSDTYDNDNDGNDDETDQDCLCGDPNGGGDETFTCIGYHGDNGTELQTSSTGENYYCDTSNGNVCCPSGFIWNGLSCVISSQCYNSPCSEKNFTPAWYSVVNCVDVTKNPTEACAYTGIKHATKNYEYVIVQPY